MGKSPLDIERTVMELIMGDDSARKKQLAKKIFDLAYKEGIFPSSIHGFYMARGRGDFRGFTVPAINLRSMTYDLARAIFRVAEKMILALLSLRLPGLRSVIPINRRLNTPA